MSDTDKDSDLGPLPIFAILFGGCAAILAVCFGMAEITRAHGPWPTIGVALVLGTLLTAWGIRNVHRSS